MIPGKRPPIRSTKRRRRNRRSEEIREEVARGLTNYNHDELERIHGRSCGDIREILGECPYEEVVHRDNIQLVG